MTINIETENAGTCPDLDETQVRSLSDNLADGLIYLIVHDSTRPLEYAQAAGDPKDKYVIEYHDAADYHYQAKVGTTAEVGNFLSGWAWQSTAGRTATSGRSSKSSGVSISRSGW